MQLIYGKKSFMFDVILVGKSNFSQSAQGRKYCRKHFCNTCGIKQTVNTKGTLDTKTSVMAGGTLALHDF